MKQEKYIEITRKIILDWLSEKENRYKNIRDKAIENKDKNKVYKIDIKMDYIYEIRNLLYLI